MLALLRNFAKNCRFKKFYFFQHGKHSRFHFVNNCLTKDLENAAKDFLIEKKLKI